MRIGTHFTALVVLVTALSCVGFCQEGHPTYIVVIDYFLGFDFDKAEISLEYAHRLSKQIADEGLQGSTATGKDPWTCCVGKHEKQAVHCAAVYAKIDIGNDQSKNVHVYVVEGKDEGEVTEVSCDQSRTKESCYNDALLLMAAGVKNHDDSCHHPGKKCRCTNKKWVPE